MFLIRDKQLYQSSLFDKQAICEEFKKKEIKEVKPSEAMLLLISGQSYSCCKLYNFKLVSNHYEHTQQVLTSHLKKYSSIYKLIFIKTAPICSFLLNKPSTSLQILTNCATPRSKGCQRKKNPASSNAAVLSLELKLIGTLFF